MKGNFITDCKGVVTLNETFFPGGRRKVRCHRLLLSSESRVRLIVQRNPPRITENLPHSPYAVLRRAAGKSCMEASPPPGESTLTRWKSGTKNHQAAEIGRSDKVREE